MACTSMVKECIGRKNGVGCHVYLVRYLVIRTPQTLLVWGILQVAQFNMQGKVPFQRTSCLSDVLQHAAARTHWPAATASTMRCTWHAPYAAPAHPQQCGRKTVLETKNRSKWPTLR